MELVALKAEPGCLNRALYVKYKYIDHGSRHNSILLNFYSFSMLIKLYKSSLCPRCYLAKKSLLNLAAKNSEIHIKEIDILKAPKTVWRDGVKMIPAIKINEHILSSIYLSPQTIEDFISSYLTNKK